MKPKTQINIHSGTGKKQTQQNIKHVQTNQSEQTKTEIDKQIKGQL